MKRIEQMQYKFVHECRWTTILESELKEIEKKDKEKYKYWDNFIYEDQQCPLRNFRAHGANESLSHGSPWQNDGVRCLNDWRHDLILMLGPNQAGKTTIGAAFTMLHGLIPTNSNWACFQKNHIEYHEWTGPKIAIVSSWSWDNTEVVWKAYQRLLPRKELGRYARWWGAYSGERGAAQEMTFRSPTAKVLNLTCGSTIIFLCYTQQQIHWEGKQCDLAHTDEQPPEDKMDGLLARQLTRGAYTPIIMTLTGHILPARPDTGAQGWIKTKMIDQGLTKGRKFKQYQLSIESTPDALMSKEQKEATRIQWVDEPQRTHNIQKINEGIARYWGGWQVGGGIVLSEFNPELHIVDTFDYQRHHPTYYRMIDHGQNPCAALLLAKMPWGDTLVLKEYYEYGRSISDNCERITCGMCGNTRRFVSEEQEEGMTYDIYEETETKIRFAASELDGRSFNTRSNETGQKIGMLYNRFGCRVSPARTVHDFAKDTTPLIKELFALQKGRVHLNIRLGRKFEHPFLQYGAPSIYFLGPMPHLQEELLKWIDVLGVQRRAQNKADHLISCLGFYAGRERPYMGPLADGGENVTPGKSMWHV